MQRTTELEGKRLVVTGTAGGIGAAALRALVAAGAVVAALDISDEIDEAEASKAAAAGSGKARYFHCDLRYRHEVDEVLAQAVAWLGGLDGLVNIDGVERAASAETIGNTDWDLEFDVNVRGTFHTS